MRNKPILTMLSTAVLSAAAALSVPTTSVIAAPTKAAAADKYTNKAYIVRLAEQPVTAYDGSIKGFQATRPRKGEKIDPNSPAVVNYRAFLESRHDAVLASVGGGRSSTATVTSSMASLQNLLLSRLRSLPQPAACFRSRRTRLVRLIPRPPELPRH